MSLEQAIIGAIIGVCMVLLVAQYMNQEWRDGD